MQILDIDRADYDAVLALNSASVPHVNNIGIDQLDWFAKNAVYFRAARINDRLAGFLIGLRPGTTYASLNYRWFCEHYDDFAYVDRVAVNEWAQRQGVAGASYSDFADSQTGVSSMTCEINIRPTNIGSMQFHTHLGFKQVGSQEIDSGAKQVALMEKTL